MALHMRKLVSVLLALIMMMSAAPVFADDEQTAEQVDAAEVTEPAEAEEFSEPEESVKSEQVTEVTAPSTEADNIDAENEAEWVEITLYDAGENKLEDREKVQIENGMTMKEMLDIFSKERHYLFDWGKCTFTVNDNPEDEINIEEYELKPEDSIVIKAPQENNAEKQAQSEELQLTAVAAKTLSNAYKSTESAVKQIAASSNWAFGNGNEWIVIGLSRSGKISDAEVQAYCSRIAAYLDSRKSDKLSEDLSTDNSRLVLSLTSIGYNPTNVNGHNLLRPLADMNYIKKQGLSGPVWALIAFDSYNYRIPAAKANEKQTTREGLVNFLVGSQIKNEGWDMSGKKPDVDMTCMVLQALAPYYNDDNPAVKTAVDNALKWLSSVQNADGSFCSGTSVSSESQSQVIVALTALGVDPEKVVRGNNSALDSLMRFYVSGGGFKHVLANRKLDNLSSQQGYYALAAYYRFRNGKTSLYDMSDMILKAFKGVARKGDTGSAEKKIKTAGKAMGKTRALGYLALGDDQDIDKSLIKENFSGDRGNQSAIAQQKAYNEYIKTVKLAKTLPWIYAAIAAMALMGLLLVLRNRKPE